MSYPTNNGQDAEQWTEAMDNIAEDEEQDNDQRIVAMQSTKQVSTTTTKTKDTRETAKETIAESETEETTEQEKDAPLEEAEDQAKNKVSMEEEPKPAPLKQLSTN